MPCAKLTFSSHDPILEALECGWDVAAVRVSLHISYMNFICLVSQWSAHIIHQCECILWPRAGDVYGSVTFPTVWREDDAMDCEVSIGSQPSNASTNSFHSLLISTGLMPELHE